MFNTLSPITDETFLIEKKKKIKKQSSHTNDVEPRLHSRHSLADPSLLLLLLIRFDFSTTTTTTTTSGSSFSNNDDLDDGSVGGNGVRVAAAVVAVAAVGVSPAQKTRR